MKPIIVACDVATKGEVQNLVDALDPSLCQLKVGKELFTFMGPEVVTLMQKKGFDVFLDLKFHDIPNTVANAVHMAANLGVWMVNVHALGGRKMMEAAKSSLINFKQPPLLIAVTLLTSMSEEMAHEVGLNGSKDTIVSRLTQLVLDSGLDGVVCSANEAKLVADETQNKLMTVCPGIRLDNTVVNDDQTRVMTPKRALKEGATYLVIGRPITQAEDPRVALDNIISMI